MAVRVMPSPSSPMARGAATETTVPEDDEQGQGYEREGNELGAPEVLAGVFVDV